MSQTLDLRIDRPCPVPWENMEGAGRARLCGSCGMHVYDIRGLREPEVVELVRSREGRTCVRAVRRPDGHLMLGPCPAAAAAVVERVDRWAQWVGPLLVAAGLGAIGFGVMEYGGRFRALFETADGDVTYSDPNL